MKINNEFNGKEIGGVRKQQRSVPGKAAEADGKESAVRSESSAESERISLSPESKDVERLKQAMAELPEVRSERVESLRGSINAGTYQVPLDQVAEKMVDEMI